jgi:hypothetical protein
MRGIYPLCYFQGLAPHIFFSFHFFTLRKPDFSHEYLANNNKIILYTLSQKNHMAIHGCTYTKSLFHSLFNNQKRTIYLIALQTCQNDNVVSNLTKYEKRKGEGN